MEQTGVATVFLLALLTAGATGLGALPFAFAKHPTRRWLGTSNAVAGLMLAASFGVIYEGVNHGLFRTLAGALEEASENLIAVMITLSVVAMVAFQVLIR